MPKATPTLDVGRNVSTDYVYKLAYIYLNGSWQSQNLTSSSALVSSNWYTAFASVPLPSSSITSSWTYVVGYVCAWNGFSWHCGCADSSCTTGYWQLQAYERPAQTTTTTTSNTTGNCTPSSSGTTITPGSGTITDGSCNSWTVTSGGLIAKNGVTNASYSGGGVILMLYYNGSVYQENSGHSWYQWNGSG